MLSDVLEVNDETSQVLRKSEEISVRDTMPENAGAINEGITEK